MAVCAMNLWKTQAKGDEMPKGKKAAVKKPVAASTVPDTVPDTVAKPEKAPEPAGLKNLPYGHGCLTCSFYKWNESKVQGHHVCGGVRPAIPPWIVKSGPESCAVGPVLSQATLANRK